MLQMACMPRFWAITSIVVTLAACCPEAQVDERGWPRQLVLGLVPALEAEALVDDLQPLTAHLSAELGIPVRAFVPQDYTGLVEALGSGRADIGMLPPFATMLGMRRYDIEPLLLSVRRGETGYRPQWMTNDPRVCDEPPQRNENGFLECRGELEQMRGHSVAFTDPNSTSGFLFPVLQLRDHGIDHERDLRSIFVGGHDAVVLAVYSGDVRFGVAYDDARTRVQPQYPDVGDKVIVFGFSTMIPNDGVQVRAGLPPDLKAAIRDAFKSLADAEAHLPEDEKVLWILYEIDNFTDVPPGLYDPVADAYQLLRR
jgi:phosphonate transport system substrate-binding protein